MLDAKIQRLMWVIGIFSAKPLKMPTMEPVKQSESTDNWDTSIALAISFYERHGGILVHDTKGNGEGNVVGLCW